MSKTFIQDMNKVIKDLKNKVEEATITALNEQYRTLVMHSPFDIGQLMSNWKIGLNSTHEGVDYFKLGTRIEAEEAFENAMNEEYNLEQYSMDDKVHFFNNVYYAHVAEIYSRKAGYMKRAKQRAETEFPVRLQEELDIIG